MTNSIDLILKFLTEKPGYAKESKSRLYLKLYSRSEFNKDPNKCSITYADCGKALKIFRRQLKSNNTKKIKRDCTEIIEKSNNKNIPQGFEIKSKWQSASGEWLMSLKPSVKEVVTNEDFKINLINDLKAYSPSFPTIKRNTTIDENILVLDIADLHIGKLAVDSETGEPYNNEIAINRALEGVQSILQKSSGFNITKILLPIGNDILHTDSTIRKTTSGTPQDTDGMWHENFKLARKLYTDIIEVLILTADVHVVHCPSNHDYMSGFMLAEAIYCWFNKSENVTFDITNNHRKYFKYGNNLIGLSHGDGAKETDMPLLMANEVKQDWANTDYRYIYLHHVHHKIVTKFQSGKDYQGVTIEYLRSPSSSDAWHSRNGYQHSKKAIEAFIHSYNDGQIARLTHNFK